MDKESVTPMRHHANPYCETCHLAHNGLNGRYCEQLRRYVEHEKEPRCND